MVSKRMSTPALLGLVLLGGCLTPSMGRKADQWMGGDPSPNPVSVRDVESSRLVGFTFDGKPMVPDTRLDEAGAVHVKPAPLRP